MCLCPRHMSMCHAFQQRPSKPYGYWSSGLFMRADCSSFCCRKVLASYSCLYSRFVAVPVAPPQETATNRSSSSGAGGRASRTCVGTHQSQNRLPLPEHLAIMLRMPWGFTAVRRRVVALRHSGGGPRGGGVPPAARQTPESSGEKKSIVVDPCLCGRAPWRRRSSVAWARMAAASWGGGGGSVGEA